MVATKHNLTSPNRRKGKRRIRIWWRGQRKNSNGRFNRRKLCFVNKNWSWFLWGYNTIIQFKGKNRSNIKKRNKRKKSKIKSFA